MASWLNNAIFYEIYPQSFNDSNGDGIGDFQGIIDKLQYVRDLGCNAIWINPCFDSSFYDAGYDVRDYYITAERYGSNADLLAKLGKHRIGKGCLYVNKLEDVDLDVLRQLIRRGWADTDGFADSSAHATTRLPDPHQQPGQPPTPS